MSEQASDYPFGRWRFTARGTDTLLNDTFRYTPQHQSIPNSSSSHQSNPLWSWLGCNEIRGQQLQSRTKLWKIPFNQSSTYIPHTFPQVMYAKKEIYVIAQ
jgi:hypothetical protein